MKNEEKNILGKEELDTLIESLDCWVARDMTGELIGGLFESMMTKNLSEKRKKELDLKKEKETKIKEDKKQKDKEFAIILKAKLISMKREI